MEMSNNIDGSRRRSANGDNTDVSNLLSVVGTNQSTRVDLGDCRFYEQLFPEPDDLVMVKVNRIAEMGAYVSLIEYNNMEGMILMSELSKRRFRSVNKLLRVGKHEVVLVLRVDSQKGYIDLSKSRVSPEDIVKCEERFSKSKKVHQTVRHVAQRHGIRVDDLNRLVVWPLYKKYGHALDALKDAALNPSEIFKGIEIDEGVKNSLIQDIQLRLSPTALKLSARMDVFCFGYDGIDAVKASFKKGIDSVDDKKISVKIKLIAPPQYGIVASCYDKEMGLAIIEKALKSIEESITSYKGGGFKQQGKIIVIGSEEENRLEELLESIDEDDEAGAVSEDDDDDVDEGMGLVREEYVGDHIEVDADNNILAK